MKNSGGLVLFLILAFACPSGGAVVDENVFTELQPRVAAMSTGQRIAFWAERFVETPYDTDPLGFYVRNSCIVCDEKVDCMYLTFRAVELALSRTWRESIDRALDLRFRTRGVVDEDGSVKNYDQRFEYGEDMVLSGKWGRDITASLGGTRTVKGSRGIDGMEIIDKASAVRAVQEMKSGDIVFFIKDPAHRKVGEIVGHIGIVSAGPGGVYLIHASGTKNGNGSVKKVSLPVYLNNMPFVGIVVTRLD